MRRQAALAVTLLIGVSSGCGGGPTSAPTATAVPTAGPTPVAENIWLLSGAIDPGTYFHDPDLDPATPLRVVWEIAAEGWDQWIGGAKYSDAGHVGVSITTVVNLVDHGCNGSWASPPVGPSVDDLVSALTALPPFEVTSPPTDVTIYGYSGKHLAWTVPDLPTAGQGGSQRFTGCREGKLWSWVAPFDLEDPGDAFYGYTGPGYTEEFWVLDVEGTRLMIAAETSAGSPAQDIAERDAILDSIRIEP